MTPEASKVQARIPQVDRLVQHPRLVELSKLIRREIIVELTRMELGELRRELKEKTKNEAEAALESDNIAERIERRALALLRPHVRPVINGTGVILNTNLGRAPLPDAVAAYLSEVARSYTNLEIDLSTGKRGERGERIDELVGLLTGAERAIVVNNNASSVLLSVAALARNKEVIVSRGELIEIGGSFRLPDVIESAGGILKEVGTTNRTRLSDYKKAVSKETGMILKCHRSNFAITGFTEETTIAELALLGKEAGVPILKDLGSGALIDIHGLGLPDEPTVGSVIRDGADLVMFSGDKLLGGPQAGIIAGKKELVDALRKHAIYRALRADKLTVAYLEQVLSIYLSPGKIAEIPALSLAMVKSDDIKERVNQFLIRNRNRLTKIRLSASETDSALGGGTIPGKTLSSWAIKVAVDEGDLSAQKLSELLRQGEPPVIGIIRDEFLNLDFRTVRQDEEEKLIQVLVEIDRSLTASTKISQ